MFCPKCGTELFDDAHFCTKCGTSISSDTYNSGVYGKNPDSSGKHVPPKNAFRVLLVLGIILFIAAIYFFGISAENGAAAKTSSSLANELFDYSEDHIRYRSAGLVSLASSVILFFIALYLKNYDSRK
ncbi:MAG: zinc-ribbon domain-containing protein [Lachnospiraceae bacterium]|nr:zinc-ribbon domain-containing protein [Lachnospiraceae bacterium]